MAGIVRKVSDEPLVYANLSCNSRSFFRFLGDCISQIALILSKSMWITLEVTTYLRNLLMDTLEKTW